MRIVFKIFLSALLLFPCVLLAQQEVELGGHRFIPPQNMEGRARGTASVETRLRGLNNVLIQFKSLPKVSELAKLEQAGVKLTSYVGGNAYFAELAPTTQISDVRKLHLASSMIPVAPEWKLSTRLTDSALPLWATADGGKIKAVIRFAGNSPRKEIESILQSLELTNIRLSPVFDQVDATGSFEQLKAAAKLPWVLEISPIDPPAVLWNEGGARIGRARVLNYPTALGGRGLLGKGRKVGIWDGQAIYHPDYGTRVHPQEYEYGIAGENAEKHGSHVTGTILGAGLLDPEARGMAPLAESYNYNFNIGSNGLNEREEMALAREKFGLHAISNSYGSKVVCENLQYDSYANTDYQIDALANKYPTLTHVYAAGNYQMYCQKEIVEMWGREGYGTTTRRSKNIISVGAIDDWGQIGSFSSFGPLDDGRLFPLLVAKGVQVKSTIPGKTYDAMDGTSMACPTVTGHVLLMQERYAQLHNGEEMRSDLVRALLANTATDEGEAGPDFQFGYGIMDAEKAVQAMENSWYLFGEVESNKEISHEIVLPNGVTAARVMLVWNDPVSQRSYKPRQSCLVNDLDLRVMAGNTEYAPWVLNPTKGKVADPAERKNDNLNNIEQVTLTQDELGGTTKLHVKVKGTRITDGKQQYVVVWWSEGAGRPRVISPRGGDCLYAGEYSFAALENVEAPYRIEMSYDGGKNYRTLGTIAYPYMRIRYRIAPATQATNKAKFRIVDAKGRIAESEGYFRISDTITNVKFAALPQCGLKGWKLTWDAVNKPNTEYAILLADKTKGEWSMIGHTNKTEYEIPEEILQGVKDAIFSVAVRLSETEWGYRSKAVLPPVSLPIRLKATDLPFEEYFSEAGSQYYTILGESLKVQYYYTSQKLLNHPGANILYIGTSRAKGFVFDQDGWFDKTKNPNTVSELVFCSVDLRDIPADQKVQFSFIGALTRHSKNTNLTSSRLRILDNGTVLKDSYGREVIEKSNGVEEYYYQLEGGKEHNLVMQHCGERDDDKLTLNRIAISSLDGRKDIGVAMRSEIKNEQNMGKTTYQLLVHNFSTESIKRAEVRVYLNGQWVTSSIVEDIAGKTAKEVPFTVDLSTSDPLGKKHTVRVEALLEDDINPRNNQLAFEVINYGETVVHPLSPVVQGYEQDPKKIIEVEKPFIYTDNGGAYGDYPFNQRVTLQFRPKDPNMRVRVHFRQVNLVGDSAYLTIYTQDIPDTWELTETPERTTITKTEKDATFTSEAQNGSVIVLFRAKNEGKAAGWIAEVDLVPMNNPLSVVSAEARAQDDKKEGTVPVTVVVRNNYAKPVKNVHVALYSPKYRQYFLDEVVAELKPGENTINLGEITSVPQHWITDCFALVQTNEDTYGKDNMLRISLGHDRYPIPGIFRASFPQFFYVEVNREMTYTLDSPAFHIVYEVDPPIVVYKDDKDIALKFEVQQDEDVDEDQRYYLSVWVDWNNNGVFEASEGKSKRYKNEELEPSITMPIPTGQKEGMYRARFVLCQPSEKDAAPNFVDGLISGDIRDVTFDLKERNPKTNDLELVVVDAGKSGIGLSAAQEIKLKLRNASRHAYCNLDQAGEEIAKPLRVKVVVDGATEQVEVVEVLVPGKESENDMTTTEVTLKQIKADLHAEGRHEIVVTIEEMETVVNPKNNTLIRKVYGIKPKLDDAQYGLSFTSLVDKNKKQVADLSALSERLASLQKGQSYTFEMLFKAESTQPATLLLGKKFAVQLANNSEYGFPLNSIGVICGDYSFSWTDRDDVTFGRWHHLAVEVNIVKLPTEQTSGETQIRIWLDGKPLRIHRYGFDIPDFRDLELGKYFNGEIDEFRCLRGKVDEAKLKEYMFKHYYQNGKLPQNVMAEYSFDEGVGNWASISDGKPAGLELTDKSLVDKTEGGIWKKQGELLGIVQFEGMVGKPKFENGKWILTFRKVVDKTKVRGSIIPNWSSTELTYGGKPVQAEQVYDFTNDVEIDAKAILFGKQYLQKIVFSFKADESDACDLLSLKLEKDLNAGLKSDVEVLAPIPTICPIPLVEATHGQITDLTKVKVTFTQSAEAKVYLDEVKAEKEVVSGSTEIDFKHPRILVVEAKNKNVKRYEIALLHEQTLSWDLSKTSYIYGDAPVVLMGSASSGLLVQYVSDKPAVASVANGKLYLGEPGVTTLRCEQGGDQKFAPATSVEKTITVNRKAITLIPSISTKVSYGSPIDWEFRSEGFVTGADAKEIEVQKVQKFAKLTNAKNESVAWEGVLPVGSYKVSAQGEMETEHYRVSMEDFVFEVVADKQVEVLFVVKDTEGAVAGATIVAGKARGVTDVQGAVRLALNTGVATKWIATKNNIRKTGEVVPTTEKENKVEIVFPREDITLTYTSTGHCTLYGVLVQNVAPGMATTEVLVVPELGYEFVQWDDGRKDNPRIDRDLTSSRTLTAQCKAKVYRVHYSIAGGAGKWIHGMQEQQVEYGAAGTEVTVAPADANSVFVRWSDGKTELSRKETNVKMDQEYVAYFTSYENLPAREDFEAGTLHRGWFTYSDDAVYNPMKIVDDLSEKPFKLDGKFLICDNRKRNLTQEYTVWLYSPRYRVAGLTKDLQIHFDYAMLWGGGIKNVLDVSYSVDGNTWIDFVTNTEATTTARMSIDAELAKGVYTGADFIQFRVKYISRTGWYMAMDNIHIFEKADQTLNLTYKSEPAGAGYFEIEEEKKSSQQVEYGKAALVVTAKAKKGYRFVRWKEGDTVANLRLSEPVFADATYTALFVDDKQVRISYAVQPRAAGKIQFEDGSDAAYEWVTKGADSREVKAVSNPGWHFAYWLHDASKTETSRQKGVQADRNVVAVFVQAETAVRFEISVDKGEMRDGVLQIASKFYNIPSDGVVSFTLPKGRYKYVLSAPKYETQQNELVVGETEVVQPIILKRRSDAPALYTVTYTDPKNGSLEISNAGANLPSGKELEAGTDLLVTVKADKEYELESLTLNGVEYKEQLQRNRLHYTLESDLVVVAKFKSTTLTVEDARLLAISVVPNPFTDRLRIVSQELGIGIRYELLMLGGQLLRRGELKEGETVLETRDLAAGVYFLHFVAQDGGERTIQVVKE